MRFFKKRTIKLTKRKKKLIVRKKSCIKKVYKAVMGISKACTAGIAINSLAKFFTYIPAFVNPLNDTIMTAAAVLCDEKMVFGGIMTCWTLKYLGKKIIKRLIK